LKVLDLAGNRGLTGTLPSELGLLTNLLAVRLDDTNLTGSLPAKWCDILELVQELLSCNTTTAATSVANLCGCHCPC